jgi:hypothetical protein
MKRPQRKEDNKIGKQFALLKSTAGLDLDSLAQRVTYTGNAKHKKTPWFGGAPRPDTQGTLCPNELHDQQVNITAWLREAVLKGAIDHRYAGGDGFPQHIWYMDGATMYEAKLDDRYRGTYHGYPLKNSNYWPRGYERIYGEV